MSALVTGGSGGIGRAVVERLHADGADVVSCGRGRRPDDDWDLVVGANCRGVFNLCRAVLPGWIDTGMADEAFAYDPAAARRDAVDRHPAGRLGRPADIASAVAWLASAAAEFVTGRCFTIDGGLSASSPLRPGAF